MKVKEYAERIASGIEGSKVETVVKNNGVELTGIYISRSGSNISPMIYVDDMYNKGISVESAREKILNMVLNCEKSAGMSGIDVESLKDWDFVKNKVRPIMIYGSDANKGCGIWRDASRYGFPGLIISVRIEFYSGDGIASIRVKENMLNVWNKTSSQVINAALKNMEDPKIMTIEDVLSRLGVSDSSSSTMLVVTNSRSCMGAVCVLKAADKLKEIFPEGYVVIPSSVHEVIVIPKIPDFDDTNYINSIIEMVNATDVSDTEILGHMGYVFE